MTKTTITTRTVGQAFGTEAVVRAPHGRIIYTTRTYPYGFTGPALRDAEAWVDSQKTAKAAPTVAAGGDKRRG
jgi:hypothetical protein